MIRILLLCLTACSLLGFAGTLQAQELTVSGRVTSAEDTSPIPGVNVVVKGTTVGTTTDIDGRYTISTQSNATLVFTFIGLQTQEVAVNGRSTINVSMNQDVQQLNEVVVTGLNIPREKASLGYSVGEVKGDELAQVNQTNIVNSLS